MNSYSVDKQEFETLSQDKQEFELLFHVQNILHADKIQDCEFEISCTPCRIHSGLGLVISELV